MPSILVIMNDWGGPLQQGGIHPNRRVRASRDANWRRRTRQTCPLATLLRNADCGLRNTVPVKSSLLVENSERLPTAPGTPGHDQLERYLVAHFREFGCDEVRVEPYKIQASHSGNDLTGRRTQAVLRAPVTACFESLSGGKKNRSEFAAVPMLRNSGPERSDPQDGNFHEY